LHLTRQAGFMGWKSMNCNQLSSIPSPGTIIAVLAQVTYVKYALLLPDS
jgi:hypothetical protein